MYYWTCCKRKTLLTSRAEHYQLSLNLLLVIFLEPIVTYPCFLWQLCKFSCCRHTYILGGPFYAIRNTATICQFLIWNCIQLNFQFVLHRKACYTTYFQFVLYQKAFYTTYFHYVCNRKALYRPYFQCVCTRKASYTTVFRVVLNRKASYTTWFSICIKSKSILYNSFLESKFLY